MGLRIISGKLKRRQVETITTNEVRPTTDRVRQTMFDVLSVRLDFENLIVLDSFAGSGILGIESISRGAERVTFVEENTAVIHKLSESIQKLKIESQSHILKQDAIHFLRQTSEQFDLIFADPPYRYDKCNEIIELVMSRSLLLSDGYLVLEHHHSTQFDEMPEFSFKKEFGTTTVSFFQTKGRSA